MGYDSSSGILTPYVVPYEQHPNGYYVGRTPLSASGILGTNTEGYAGYWQDTYGN
jgi:hypothetical protein